MPNEVRYRGRGKAGQLTHAARRVSFAFGRDRMLVPGGRVAVTRATPKTFAGWGESQRGAAAVDRKTFS